MNIDFSELTKLTEWCDCEDGFRYTPGKFPSDVVKEKCTSCNQDSEGKCPTAFGEKVLDLVQKFLVAGPDGVLRRKT